MNRKLVALGVVAAATLSSCASASTPPDMVALHYQGGTTQAKKFVDCLDPSKRSGFDPGDTFIGYPTRQVSFDATGGKDAEADPFKVVSKDNAELGVPATITFRLKSDCATLRKMHETVGARYNAGFDPNDEDGTGQSNAGWTNLLNYVIGKPLDTSLDRMAQQYRWRDLWNNPAVKTRLETEVNDSISDLVARQAGGDFFEDFSVLVQKPEPTQSGLKEAIALEQTEVAKSQADKARAEADEARARAQVAVARAEAAKKQAEINGYRLKGMSAREAAELYNESLMIEKGLNSRQPTYLVNGTKP
jgi:regulator of protease activity HflC (stomatin/prohibitin superfamily)